MNTRLSLLGTLLMIPMFTGCATDKLTRTNYDMIREGTTNKEEVALTLGNDYVTRGENEWEYEREDKHLTVYIHYGSDGRVVRKEWIDAARGEWDGAAPGIRDPQTEPQYKSNTTISP